MSKSVKGYKVFNSDWTCRGFKYEVGRTYKEDVDPRLCSRGFHFCEKIADCFNYYSFDVNNRIAEVEAIGVTVTGDDKSATNEIFIFREITWEEMLKLANNGKGNTGLSNSGNRNSGNRNSGDSNSGYSNSGYSNSGYWNSGNRNSGYWNSGNRNSGYWNSGDYNTGDFNLSDSNTGCFCMEEKTIEMFDKPTGLTIQQWQRSDAYRLLRKIKYMPTTWIWLEDMTEQEQKDNKDCETLGGYLRENDLTKVNQEWWDKLTNYDKQIIKEIPNFDADKFQKIMGIKM